MTKDELKTLTLNQRVKIWKLDLEKKDFIRKYGYVTKIYNKNWQVQVLFDGDKKPSVVGYSRLKIVN